jgi:DNA-binding MarR family transcriptional regulator
VRTHGGRPLSSRYLASRDLDAVRAGIIRADYYSSVIYSSELDNGVAQSLPSDRKATPLLHRHHPAVGTPFESLTASFRVLRRLVAEELEEERVAVTDYWALTGIEEGETSPTALGRALAVSPAGITQLLDRLEDRGLIRRSRNPGDRRATVLSLSPEGRHLQRRAQARCSRLLDNFASELSPAGLAALQTFSREFNAVLSRRASEPAQPR